MARLYLGIDPGLKGAIARFREGKVLDICDMPVTETVVAKKRRNKVDPYALGTILDLMTVGETDVLAVVEKVGPRDTDGPIQAFSFGTSYGVVLGVIGARHISMERVLPQIWKRAMGASSDKKQSIARATHWLPDAQHWWTRVKDDGRAEAAMLAYFGWKVFP